MSVSDTLLKFLQPKIGNEIHVGPWLTVDQRRKTCMRCGVHRAGILE